MVVNTNLEVNMRTSQNYSPGQIWSLWIYCDAFWINKWPYYIRGAHE